MQQNQTTNATSDDLHNLTRQLGIRYPGKFPYPSSYSWDHIVAASLTVSAIMTAIVVGNGLVVLAISTDKNLKGVQNWFVASLAVSDLLVGLFIMPLSLANELMGYWYFGDTVCELWLSTDVLLCTASILNLCLISLDRYWSITRAITYIKQRTKNRVILMISIVWLMSMTICFPPLVGWKRPQPTTSSGFPLCILSEEPGYVVYSSIGSFYLPLVVMVLVYFKIYKAAKKRARRNLTRSRARPLMGNGEPIVRQSRNHATTSVKSNPDGNGTMSAFLTVPDQCNKDEVRSSRLEVEVGLLQKNNGKKEQSGKVSPSGLQTGRISPTGLQSGKVPPSGLQSGRISPTGLQSSKVSPSGLQSRKVLPNGLQSSDKVSPNGLHSGKMPPNGLQVPNGNAPAKRELIELVHISDNSNRHVSKNSVPTYRYTSRYSETGNRHAGTNQRTGSDLEPRTNLPLAEKESSPTQMERLDQPHQTEVTSGGGIDQRPPLALQLIVGHCVLRTSRSPSQDVTAIEPARRQSKKTIGHLPGNVLQYIPAILSRRLTSGFLHHAHLRHHTTEQRRHLAIDESDRARRRLARARERRAIVVLGIVMASFVGCWLPFFSIYPIMSVVGVEVPSGFFAVIFWLGYCNSALNPIIYTIFNQDFRNAFAHILFRRRNSFRHTH